MRIPRLLGITTIIVGLVLALCHSVNGQVTPIGGGVTSTGYVGTDFNHVGGGTIYRTPAGQGNSNSARPQLFDEHTDQYPQQIPNDPGQVLKGRFALEGVTSISSVTLSANGSLSVKTDSVEGTNALYRGQYSVTASAAHNSLFRLTQPMRYSVRYNAKATHASVGQVSGYESAGVWLIGNGVRLFNLGRGGNYTYEPSGTKSGVLEPGDYQLTATVEGASNFTNSSEASIDYTFQVGPPVQEPTAYLIFYSKLRVDGKWFGHAFLELRPKNGAGTTYGYFSRSGIAFSSGQVATNSYGWDYAIMYPISDQQYERARAQIDHDLHDPPYYNFVSNNCADWIVRIAAAAGVTLPPVSGPEDIADPTFFGNWLRVWIGVGQTWNGGLVIQNTIPNSLPRFASTTDAFASPYSYSYALTTEAGHADAAQLAQTMGLALDLVDLGTITANSTTGLTIQLSGADPGDSVISMSWGDASTDSVQALSFTHAYASGTFPAHLLVIDNGAVHSYKMTVQVTSAPAANPQISVSVHPPLQIPNVGLTLPTPTELPGFYPILPTSLAQLPNGHVQVRFKGVPNWPFTIQAGNDLQGFSNVGNATTDVSGNLQFEDTIGITVPRRFYRATNP